MAAKKKRPALGDSDSGVVPASSWAPRDYQQRVLDARHGKQVLSSAHCSGWESGRGPCTRFLLAWHRRAGKDRTGLEVIREESQTRVGAYWHLYPLHVHARRAIWTGVDPESERQLMDLVFPPAMVAESDSRDMWKKFGNGSTYQLLGSDHYDRLVGANVCGVLISEWALCDPRAWPYIMPILMENGGWAMFIFTYRGRNHAYQMVKQLRGSPEWYTDVLTIRDTVRVDGSPVVSARDVENERKSLVAINRGNAARADAQIREEFYCDPVASAGGAIYGSQVAQMQSEGRA